MNALEVEFKAVCDAHAAEILEAYQKAKDLSDKYGIPFGSYVPQSFKEKFFAAHEIYDENDNYVGESDRVSLSFAGRVAPVDRDFWESSTTECGMYY